MTPYVSKSPRSSYFNYRDVDAGVNGTGNNSYAEASICGRKYLKGNFDQLVEVKTMVETSHFFRNEQSIQLFHLGVVQCQIRVESNHT